MTGQPNEVLDQWDLIADAGELRGDLWEAFAIAAMHGGDRDGEGLPIHVVPCVPGQPVEAGARVTGMKIARIDGAIGIYLFAEAA